MHNFCLRLFARFSFRLFIPALIIFLCAGCQFIKIGKEQAPATPCIVLALPTTGPYAPISSRIQNGAELAVAELSKNGVPAQLEKINTEEPDWLQKLEALPAHCAVVGGPLQDKKYLEASKAGMLVKKVFFAFLPTLQKNEEGAIAWRFFPSQQDQIDALVGFAATDLNISSFGAFYPADAFGRRMTELLEKTLTDKQMSLQKAEYNPNASATWSAAVKPLIQPSPSDGSSSLVPHTSFEAIFLPDSWKNMDMLTTSLLYNGEDRLVLLGPSLWEQGLANRKINKPQRYALAVFPAAWNSQKAPKELASGVDFWKSLGFDFVNFALRLGIYNKIEKEEVIQKAQRASSAIRALAPMRWDSQGIAHESLYLFQIGPQGMQPLNIENFKKMRASIMDQAALRMSGLNSDGLDPDIPAEPTAAAAPQFPVQPAVAPTQPDAPANQAVPVLRSSDSPPIETTPQPSYKLRLPTKRQ